MEITIALSIPAIIGAFLGMNVPLPPDRPDLAFRIIVSPMGILAAVTFIISGENCSTLPGTGDEIRRDVIMMRTISPGDLRGRRERA
jgi:hypothetical protein